jgi:hypothetical protein
MEDWGVGVMEYGVQRGMGACRHAKVCGKDYLGLLIATPSRGLE